MAGRLLAATASGLVAALLPCVSAGAGHDNDGKPKWEIGLAGGAGWSHHYPGADQGGGAALVLPYLIYRTERLRIGEGGLASGRLFESERIELTASIEGSLPASSDDNRAREGMPDLDTLIEVGPQLVLTLKEREDIDSLSLRLPLRAVLSTDFSNLKYRGLLFQPRLSYSRDVLFGTGASGSVSVGPIFAADKLMDYFYDVPARFATPTRPAFEARSGYMGTDLTAGLTYPVTDRFRIVIGGGFRFLAGNTNADSPLFRSKVNYRAGIGFVWKILVSESTVPD